MKWYLHQCLEKKKSRGSTNSHGDRLNYMADSDGWVMCRHPGFDPFVMALGDWEALPLFVEPES